MCHSWQVVNTSHSIASSQRLSGSSWFNKYCESNQACYIRMIVDGFGTAESDRPSGTLLTDKPVLLQVVGVYAGSGWGSATGSWTLVTR